MKGNLVQSTAVALLLGAAVLTTTSCSHKIGFARSSVVPADRLQPPRQAYVVWIETDGSGVKNLGQLNSGSGLLSKTLKAELNTVTPFKPTRLFITAEDDARITYPSALVVLNTDRFN